MSRSRYQAILQGALALISQYSRLKHGKLGCDTGMGKPVIMCHGFARVRVTGLNLRTSKARPPRAAPTTPIPLTSPLDGEKKFFLPRDEPMHALGATLNSTSHPLKGAQVRITFVFSQLFFHRIRHRGSRGRGQRHPLWTIGVTDPDRKKGRRSLT
jgi:hypothetical protein